MTHNEKLKNTFNAVSAALTYAAAFAGSFAVAASSVPLGIAAGVFFAGMVYFQLKAGSLTHGEANADPLRPLTRKIQFGK